MVAPGTTILSTRSLKIDLLEYFADNWGISGDDKWCYENNISITILLVMGCYAVICSAIVDTFPIKKPLVTTVVKAVLINRAVLLKG